MSYLQRHVTYILLHSLYSSESYWHACLAEPLQDLLALRYCLCSIARCMALQFAGVDGTPFSLHLRRMLFLAFSTWTEEGAIPGQPAWSF